MPPLPVPARFRCADQSADILNREFCLSGVSKNAEGKLQLIHHQPETCAKLDCVTLKVEQVLTLEVKSEPHCDSAQGKLFDGAIRVSNLAQAFENGDGLRRGFHGGDFRWLGQAGLLAVGTLSGMTNAGVLRAPVFQPACEACDQRGVMLGRFCGVVRRAPEEPALLGSQLFGVYRLQFDPAQEGGQGALRGTFEGVLERPCPS
jgi:hypothetical protein